MSLDRSRLDPDAACPCGSGLTYRDCHKDINEAAPAEVFAVAQRDYSRRWQGNAAAYERQGLYAKLAEHLFAHIGSHAKILDVGCGRGEGLSALRSKMSWPGSKLVGVDENYECLSAAGDRLGIVTPPPRLRRIGGDARDYDLEIVPGRFPAQAPVTLVHSEMLRPDDEFVQVLVAMAPLDAVTLWFSGSHAARQFDREVQRLQLPNDKALRHSMEYVAMENATALVRPGGSLHIVHRASTNQPAALAKELREELEKLPNERPMTIVDVRLEPYEEPRSGARIGVADPLIRPPEDSRSYAVSVIFRVE